MAEKDLERLISGMSPKLREGEYYIGSFDESGLMALAGYLEHILCIFREEEGLSVIFAAGVLGELGPLSRKAPAGPFSLISLTINSDLLAVGFMAEISAALAKEKIPCNAFSAYYHDHLLVPSGMKENTMRCLLRLAKTASPQGVQNDRKRKP